MKTPAPTLMPLFRSQTQGTLLAVLFLNPAREYSLTELAREVGATVRSVHSEVNRLVDAGLVEDRRRGTARLVRAVQRGPVTGPLTDLLAVTFGPLPVLTAALTDVQGIVEAFIYGSWAARYSGESGPPPEDVDVLVIGDADADDLDAAARRAQVVLRRDVNVRRLRNARWREQTDPFVRTILDRPLVPLSLRGHEGHA